MECFSFAGKGANSWRVPTKNELKTLIHCTNKTMPNDSSTCGDGNSTSPTVNNLFPNTVALNYWSSSVSNSSYAWYVLFNYGNVSDGYSKSNSLYVRCVLTGQ